MTGMNLALTDRFRHEDAQVLQTELHEHLDVGEPDYISLKSAEPPSFIQLLGSVLTWGPLVVGAKAYVSALAKRAADATWDGLESWWRNEEAKPLIDVARALVKTADTVSGEVTLRIGLDIPDVHFGTALSIKSKTPEDVAHAIAMFAARANELSRAMRREVDAGRTPLGPATIEMKEDGSLVVRWVTRTDFAQRELRFPAPN